MPRTYTHRGITILPVWEGWAPQYRGATREDSYPTIRAARAAIDFHLEVPWDCHGTLSETPNRHGAAVEVTHEPGPMSDQIGAYA